jgi:hypothetical protein
MCHGQLIANNSYAGFVGEGQKYPPFSDRQQKVLHLHQKQQQG